MDRQRASSGTVVRRRPKDRRETLITAAAHLFRDRGYHGVTMEQIGSAVGISGPAVYNHFPRKEHILVAVMERVTEISRRDFELAKQLSGSPRDAVRILVEGHVRLVLEHGHLSDVHLREMDNLPKDELARFNRGRRQFLSELTDYLCALVSGLAPEEARTRLLAVFFGLLSSVPMTHSRLERSQLERVMVHLAMTTLLAPATEP